jgi:ATP-dependent DNA helicase RecQ
VLFREKPVTMPVRMEHISGKAPGTRQKGRSAGSEMLPASDGLLAVLKALRTRLAHEANVPAYIIFSNAALSDMAARKPLTMGEFLEVSGVGEVKAGRYGEMFLHAIREYEKGENDQS